jgi:hypothetical protein
MRSEPKKGSNFMTTSPAAILAGTAAGAVDIGAAALINHQGPAIILQSIASGLLGLGAYSGGYPTILLGLALQLAMSIAIAGIYAVAAMRLNWLLRHPVSAGLAYGAGVFVVMNLVVVPLSAFAPRPTHISLSWLALNVGAMLIFGLIVASLVTRLVDEGLAAS